MTTRILDILATVGLAVGLVLLPTALRPPAPPRELGAVEQTVPQAPPVRTATPTPGVDYGYGSGAIGNWSTASRAISTDARFISSPVWQYNDSIGLADGSDFAQRLYDTTGLTLAVDSWASRPTGPAVDALIADLAAFPAPQLIIMATGTNDIFSPPFIASEIERVMAAVPEGTQVMWVNTYAQRWAYPPATQTADLRNSAWVNMQIAEADGRYDNLTVVGWYEFLAQYPGYRPGTYLSDGVHTSTLGRAARNALIVSAVDALL